jgi:hypothetical protein
VLVLVLGAIEVGGAKAELDVSAFFVLATRDGLRCILLSRILFCCTGMGASAIESKYGRRGISKWQTLRETSLKHRVRVEIEFRNFRLSVRG